MNIKILDSWLREHLKTKATPQKIAEVLSLTSVSVERLEKLENDHVYDIEVTTNRPDAMSVIGIAREAASALPQFGINATFIPYKPTLLKENLPAGRQGITNPVAITIKNDPSLVNRVCAVVMEVDLKNSPPLIAKRLEASGIRTLNNLVDVTNYVMREIGHPAHVFDYDRLTNHTLVIREAKIGEKLVTLDNKERRLAGGDIIADNGKGEIVDLLGVMGTANSVVTSKTKRILFFLDNNEPSHIRKTSMSLSIRTEAAVLNEKGVDPELAFSTLLRGIELYKEIANGKLLSQIIDIYPNKVKTQTITVTLEKINTTLGIPISLTLIVQILKSLGFETTVKNNAVTARVPTWRVQDVTIEEDIIEEIARVYGYHRLPSVLPPLTTVENYNMEKNMFYWEKRAKFGLKYWGFTEVYTYSLVSEDLLEGPTDAAVALANPLSNDMAYLRKTLVPSLLQVVRENKSRDMIQVFEIANVYEKSNENNLPNEIPMLAGVIKKENISFYEVKGLIEQLLNDLGIKNTGFKKKTDGGEGANVYINSTFLGIIEILQDGIIDFELNFSKILEFVTLKKVYKPLAKFPPITEDVRLSIEKSVSYQDIIRVIKKQSELVTDVSLLDVFEDKKTFRIVYQHPHKNLTSGEVGKEREKIYNALEKELHAKVS